MNLERMMQAKDKAHEYYEKVREALPVICQSCGVKADELERFLVKLLQSSVLDSAVRTLEAKAGTVHDIGLTLFYSVPVLGGLFIYARLLQEQLKAMATSGTTINFSQLTDLPAGINEMYSENFRRSFSPTDWASCKRVVAMVVGAREPVPVEIVQEVRA